MEAKEHHTKLDMGYANDEVATTALIKGVKAFAVVGVFSTIGVAAAIKFWPRFRNNLGTSGRVATAFMPPLFAYTYVAETYTSTSANPDAFRRERQEMLQNMPLNHRIANYIHHKPFQFIAAVGVPTVASLFLMNNADHLSLSQRIMSTRVMGQFSVLAILVGTMGFYDYMEKHGDFTS